MSPALPPAEPHPSSPSRCRLPPAPRVGTLTLTSGALGGPQQRQPPAQPGMLIRAPHASPVPQREPQPSPASRQQLVAGTREQLGSERSVPGSRSRESPSSGTPHLPRAAASPLPAAGPPCHPAVPRRRARASRAGRGAAVLVTPRTAWKTNPHQSVWGLQPRKSELVRSQGA